MKNLLVLLFLVELSLMSSKTITSSDLKGALSKASAGDIILPIHPSHIPLEAVPNKIQLL